MPQRKIIRGMKAFGLRRSSSSPCLWTALVLVSMVATIHTQPIIDSLYRDFQADSKNFANKDVINRCWKCHRRDDCAWGMMGECQIPIPAAVFYLERLWEGILVFAATLEVLVRGFTLGFGIRMVKYLFFEHENTDETRAGLLKSFRRKALVSAVAGLSLSAVLHGSSIFVPASMRENWFTFEEDHEGVEESPPDTTLPLVLYKYILRSVVSKFKSKDDNLSCDDFTNTPDCEIPIDWPSYFLERIGTGLKYLATTLEVLLRGFSLGLGARMLKFQFSPNDNDSSSRGADDREPEEISFFIKSLQHRLFVSTVSGISVAAVIHGSSLFVPTQMRDQWLVFK